jgi:hypothetical protein
VTSFYRHLTEGSLGYRLIRRIKIYPEFFGIRFDDDGVEYSFLGVGSLDPEFEGRVV